MPSSYGHSQAGINLANYRLLAAAGRASSAKNGYRAPYEWQLESMDHIGQGSAENQLSSTLRQASNALQRATHTTVVNDVDRVENTLRTKLNQTATLKGMLETCLSEVVSEIAELLSLKRRLEDRAGRVNGKLAVNSNRSQVRGSRPNREMTMDDVEKGLMRQQGLLTSFSDRVCRASTQVDREVQQLEGVRAKLEADLRDKSEALRVDEAVLSVPQDAAVEGGISANFRRAGDCGPKTPHTWLRGTEENLRNAHHWLADSTRLRKAVHHAVINSRTAEHDVASKLNEQMMVKLATTRSLREDLAAQLERVRDEQARARSQRSSLAAALDAKRGPLAQARERLAVRKARPSRETVADEVEAALATEVAHLAGVTQQLTDKVRAVDKEIEALDVAAAQIEDNMADKDDALRIDERCVMLDGRINLVQAPPSSVASYAMSDMSAPRTMTLQRIKDLESSLTVARREREGMEATIRTLRDTLNTPSY